MYTAPYGEQVAVQLPDGSEVQLNAGSQLTHRRLFRNWYGTKQQTRLVSLDGEAFFTVASAEKPFVVETFNASITVLGTGFNVRAYQEDDEQETVVFLEHGKVQLQSSANTTESVILDEKGASARVLDEQLVDDSATGPSYSLEVITAWRSKGFVAIGLSMPSLISHIERIYNIELLVSDGLVMTPTDLIYSDTKPALEQVLNELCLAQGCAYQKVASGYSLTPLEQ